MRAERKGHASSSPSRRHARLPTQTIRRTASLARCGYTSRASPGPKQAGKLVYSSPREELGSMNATSLSFLAAIFFLSASLSRAQTAESPNPAGAPPKFLNFVHVQLKLGRASAYASQEAALVRAYNSAQMDVHWLCLQAITGPSGVLYLNFFNSFEEYEKIFAIYGQAFTNHPEVLQMQERLQENTSADRTVIGIRRDDLGYRANAIDFSKMRRLRIHEFRIRQGRERDFAEAAATVSAAYEKIASETPWVVYQVDSGAAGSTFFVLLPMRSLSEWDSVLAKSGALSDAEAEIG